MNFFSHTTRVDAFFYWQSSLKLTQDYHQFLSRYKGYLGSIQGNLEDLQESLILLMRYIQKEKYKENFLINRIEELQEEFKSVVNLLEKEVLFSKENYKKVRKRLKKEFKPLTFSKIYKIGLSSGSEINEFISTDHQVLWVSFSTKSYGVSSELIKFIEEYLGKDTLDYQDFIETLFNLHENLKTEMAKNYEIEASIIHINLKTLEVKGNIWGDYYFLSTNKKNILFPKNIPFEREFIEKSYFNVKIERDEKILLLSPGLVKNYKQLKSEDQLVKFVQAHLENAKEDILDEILIEIKSSLDDDFFDYDSYITYLEVSPNAILDISN
ncbi:MAG: hypothetical protein H6621_04975 [Halobacteriovoraceae bacterium]|nr:hypothetical protein [Halobacteriovoraceae bacterium]